MAMIRLGSPHIFPVDANTGATYCKEWGYCTPMFSRMQAFLKKKSHRWVLPGSAIGTAQQFVGLGVSQDRLLRPIPCHAFAQLQRQHPKQRHVGRAVAALDVTDRALVRLDTLQEIG